jgi:hypothetical protein
LAQADGFYSKMGLDAAPPGIPVQRALISHREGVEKLVVESALVDDGQEFAWVIPVPAEPTEFAEADAALLNRFEKATEFYVRNKRSLAEFHVAHYFLAAAAGWLGLLLIFKPKPLLAWSSTGVVYAGLAVAAFFVADRTQEKAVMETAESVEILKKATAGSYDLAVVEAASGADLDNWLRNNGYSRMPGGGADIAGAYARAGWVFVAAKLRRDGTGFMRPHPLAITFPCDRPVYPMRLTALARSSVYLQLWVAANQRAVHPALTPVYAEAYTPAPPREEQRLGTPREELVAGFEAGRDRIYHEDIEAYLWDGAVVSRLMGRVPESAMDQDFYLERTGAALPVVYRPDAAQLMTRLRAIEVLLAVSVCLTIAGYFLRKRRTARLALGVAALLVAFTSATPARDAFAHRYHDWFSVLEESPPEEYQLEAFKRRDS